LARIRTFSNFPGGLDRDMLDSDEDVFQILFLHSDNQTVEAWETNSIECEDLINHLRAGESVFINPKKHNREKFPIYLDNKIKTPAYFKNI
jgi:hypothetical protein